MRDRQLADPGSDPVGLGRQKPVHLAVQRHLIQDLTTVGLERASVVVQGDSRHHADEPVPRQGWKTPGEERIAPDPPPAADDVVTAAQFLEKTRNVGRVVLKVTIHRHDHPAAGLIESGRQGRRLSEVASQPDDRHEVGVGELRRPVRHRRGQADPQPDSGRHHLFMVLAPPRHSGIRPGGDGSGRVARHPVVEGERSSPRSGASS